MTGIENLGLFVVAGLLLNLTPGPDVLYILSQALRRGARAGAVAALGISAGCLVHVLTAAAGLGALLAASSTAFALLKWLGVAYLAYVGIGLLRPGAAASKPLMASADGSAAGSFGATHLIAADAGAASASGQIRLQKVFQQGFWTNALNPKVALFFLAFLPQFITAQADRPWLAFLLLGLVFSFNGLWVNLGWGLLGAWAGARLGGLPAQLQRINRAAGLLFLGFALKLALTDPPAP